MDKIEVESIKKAFSIRFETLSLTELNKVLKWIEDNCEETVEGFLGVDRLTIRRWRDGSRKPSGSNKAVFLYILYSKNLKNK